MSRSAQEIQDGIIDRLSRLLGVAGEGIDPQQPIMSYGLDSVAVVAFATELEEWLGYRFHENPLEKYPTVAALARFLAEQTATRGFSEPEA
jgi:acyl carrier protein